MGQCTKSSGSGDMRDQSRNLDEHFAFVRQKLEDDNDNVIVILGEEGAGKSAFGLLYCNAISGDRFMIEDHVVNTPHEFITSVDKARRYGSIHADEGGEIFLSNEANTLPGINVKKTLIQCRRKNLNIPICVPRNFDIQKLALHRCNSMFWIYTKTVAGHVVKGYGVKYDPDKRPFDDRRRPWFKKRFHFRFPSVKSIDAEAWERYLIVKNRSGDERLGNYANAIMPEHLKPKMDADTLVEAVKEMNISDQLILRNKQGWDRELIYEKFRGTGATISMAKMASSILNDSY